MPIKKYSSDYAKESIILRVKGKTKRIEFRGGGKFPQKRGGVFITANMAIQKALERRPDFKRRWTILSSDLTRAEQLAEANRELAELDAIKMSVIPNKVPEKVPVKQETVAKEVTKFQEARNYIITAFPSKFTLAELKSKVLVREVAKKLNVSFPNWPTE